MSTDALTRQKFLSAELPRITHWLSGFQYKSSGIKPSISIGPKFQYIKIHNFPLCDDFKVDHEDIIIVTIDYPDIGIAGIHIKDDSINKTGIINKMGGHVFSSQGLSRLPDSYLKYVEEINGWSWVCFHFEGWKWDFNPRDIQRGDNLYKYILALYANLSGGFKA